ncbi:MAG TPA: helix-turn-helix transcriptional regulator [Pseudolabrys sp.]|nr:helix-turn-helix transcriptional regulator [Pseudolabrys sp.]
MSVHVAREVRDFTELFRHERYAFAAKIRLARAVLGWSQTELAVRAGLTQRAIHKLEQGETEPRRTTMRALEEIWREHHIAFEDAADGGLHVTIRSEAFYRSGARRVDAVISAISRPAA